MTASRAAIIALYEGPAYLWIKAALYALLLANFGFYLFEDWSRTSFSLTDASSFYDWVREFNTSLDEVAWFTLLLIFELETYGSQYVGTPYRVFKRLSAHRIEAQIHPLAVS